MRKPLVLCCVDPSWRVASWTHGDQQSLFEAWLSNKSAENIQAWIEAKNNISAVAQRDGHLVGFAMFCVMGEVLLCYVAPEVQFKGVGKALLGFMEDKASEYGLDAFYLESTRSAQAFYLRNGFVISGPVVQAFGMSGQPMRKKLMLKQPTDESNSVKL